MHAELERQGSITDREIFSITYRSFGIPGKAEARVYAFVVIAAVPRSPCAFTPIYGNRVEDGAIVTVECSKVRVIAGREIFWITLTADGHGRLKEYIPASIDSRTGKSVTFQIVDDLALIKPLIDQGWTIVPKFEGFNVGRLESFHLMHNPQDQDKFQEITVPYVLKGERFQPSGIIIRKDFAGG